MKINADAIGYLVQDKPNGLTHVHFIGSSYRSGKPDFLVLEAPDVLISRMERQRYHLRLAFQDIYKERSRVRAEIHLDRWYSWARRSRLDAMKQVAATIDRHRQGILAWFDSGIANGLIEGINSLVQAAKAKARGYRNR